MGKTEGNVKQGNKIYIVDPNPPEMEPHPPDDMFLYINFKADNRNRSTYLGEDETTKKGIFTNTGTEGEINFIATQVNFNAKGEITPDPQSTYATTSYTNIGGLQESNSRGNLEGFGIKNIDIKYNASLVPTVDITFTDIRGSALFDVTEHNDRKSPYSIFFKMPYPIFTLSVKGYFGKTVDYCLHMTNWTSNFDGTTGNFDISANFVGFQQAFLADMVLGNIIGVVNTSAGYNNLMKVFQEERTTFNDNPVNKRKNLTLQEIGSNVPFADVESGKKLNIRKIDDFFVRISKLQIETESLKRDSKELDKLKIINKQLSKLNRIKQFIGAAIIKEVNGGLIQGESETDKIFNKRVKNYEYEKKTNNPDIVITSDITDNTLKQGRNYLSIRDYIIFNSINIVAIERWFQTLTELINDYKTFITESGIETPDVIDIPIENSSFLEDYPYNEGSLVYSNFLAPEIPNPTSGITLDEVFDIFASKNSPLTQFYIKNQTPNPNMGFDKSKFKKADGTDLGRNNYKENLDLRNLVKVLDFTARRSKLQLKIDTLERESELQYKEAEDDINQSLNKKLDFSPKIKDVFRILCNNTDAMLQTVADITKQASQTSKKDRRKSALSAYETDIPSDNKNSYAWPRIYESKAKGVEEVYMGDIKTLTNNYSADFPEFHFIDEVFDNLVARRKKLQEISKASNLKNGLDTENWFPINPIDYAENPFILMNNLNVEEELKEEFIKQLLVRSCILHTYSKFNKNSGSKNINDYANLDGISANKSIFSTTIRSMLIEILKYEQNKIKPKNKKGLIEIAKEKNIIKEENGNYVLIEDNFNNKIGALPEISGYPMSGERNNTVDYFILKGTGDITNNGKKLWGDIKDSLSYKNIKLNGKEGKEKEDEYYKNDFKYYNYQSKLFYNVWIKPFGGKLWAHNKEYNNSLSSFSIGNINNINWDNTITYINKLHPNDISGSSINYGVSGYTLTNTDFYKTQPNKESKALLLLSTLPFKTFEEGVLKTLRDSPGEYGGARILNLPTHYLYFIGGLLYRSNFGPDDLINWDIWPNLATNKKQYLTRLGVYGKLNNGKPDVTIPLEEALLKLPTKTQNNLINYFKVWVDTPSGFADFLTKVREYTEINPIHVTLTPDQIKELKDDAGRKLVIELENLTQMVLFAPEIFNPNGLNDGLSIPINEFNGYRNNFQQKFTNINAQTNNNTTQNTKTKKENETEIKIKLEIYNYFKNINDKWIASSSGKSYNACSGQNSETSLIDYFKFLSRGWKNIGDEAVINLNSLLTLGNNLDTNMYFYISKILRDSNFLFQILPTFIDYQNPKEVQDMFKPVTIVSDSNDKRGPIYTCIYIGSSSELLDIGDQNDYYYSNDGFTFSNNTSGTGESNSNNIPADFNMGADEEREFALVAFKVAFGSENQGIFKNVSLSQQEHRETGEYFRAISDLVDKRGGTQRSYQGTDLLRLFKTRSYTCKVEALGCMNIQPLMYFDLQNVPFFHGAYLITSVSHNITPNHMTTSFTGLRQSKYNSSPVTDVTAYLNIDLNEGNNIPPVPFTNLEFTSPIFSIGVKTPGLVTWQGLFTPKNLQDIGIDKSIAANASAFKTLMINAGINSNAQAMIFLSTMITQSDFLNNREVPWEVTDVELSGCTVFKSKDNPDFNKIDPLTGQLDLQKKIYVVDSNGNGIPLRYKNNDIVHWVLCNNDAYNMDTYEILFDGSGPGGTARQYQLENEYGNDNPGDAYRFRPRGYLPAIGRGQYSELFSGTTKNKYWDDPNIITSQSLNAFEVSTLVWKKQWNNTYLKKTLNIQDKSYNKFIDKNGSASMYATITQIQPWNNKTQQEYFINFEKVLSIFGLLEYGDPVGA